MYFAIRDDLDVDGAVYCLREGIFLAPADPRRPEQRADVAVVMPPHVSPRIAAQAGVFTYHPAPNLPYDSDTIVKLRVPAATKQPARC